MCTPQSDMYLIFKILFLNIRDLWKLLYLHKRKVPSCIFTECHCPIIIVYNAAIVVSTGKLQSYFFQFFPININSIEVCFVTLKQYNILPCFCNL